MSDERAPSDPGGSSTPAVHPLAPLAGEHLENARQQTARLGAIEQRLDRLDTRTETTRRQIMTRVFALGMSGCLLAFYALNPSRTEHQAEAFAEVVAREGGQSLAARQLADRIGWRADGFRLLAIERLDLGLFSLGMSGRRTATIGVLGQVYVLQD